MFQLSHFRPHEAGRAQPALLIGGCLLLLAAAGTYVYRSSPGTEARTEVTAERALKAGPDTVQLTAEQAKEMKVGLVQAQPFAQRRDAIGLIDFNQDQTVQVFAPYQGRIGKVLVKAGDNVASGQVLYTVQVPDLAQAAATLISAAGTLKSASETLARAKALYEAQSIPQKELQQNTADQQAGEAAYRAARKTLALFGLAERDIDQIEHGHQVDTEMPVRSPLGGRVTARAAVPGQLVQPGTVPAPVSVSNMQKLWMVASVPESDLGAFRVGQKVAVTVQAYPQEVFGGEITYIGDAADATTHRMVLRAEVTDARHLLRPQMLASFRITLGAPQTSPGVPVNALAREGDGSFSAWVTTDELQFKRRTVVTGLTQDGQVQVTQGLAAGEKIAMDRALFLSNLYSTATN